MLAKVLSILVSLFLQIQSEEGYCRTYGSTSYCTEFTLQPGQHLELNNPDGVITELIFYDCSISSIPSEFFNEFRNAEKISMTPVKQSVIESDAFQGMKNLKILSLTGIDIQKIQGNLFTDLVSLEELDLVFNNLIEITPDTFVGLNKLKSLDLCFNEIETIHPESFVSLTNLQSLDLSLNPLKELKSGTFKTMQNLKELKLEASSFYFNKLSNGVFHGLTNLQYLHLGDNAIRHLKSDIFADISELIYLDLSRNQLKYITMEVFANLLKLEELALNHNHLISLSGGEFSGLLKLKRLLINDNKISQLDAINLLTELPNLKYITLNNNAWKCDNLKTILGEFNELLVEILDNYTRNQANINEIACTYEKVVLKPSSQEPSPKKEDSKFEQCHCDFSHFIEKFEEAYEKHVGMIVINAMVAIIAVALFLYRQRKLDVGANYSVKDNDVALLNDPADSSSSVVKYK